MEFSVRAKAGECNRWEILNSKEEVVLELIDEDVAEILLHHLNFPMSGYYSIYESEVRSDRWVIVAPGGDVIVTHHDQYALNDLYYHLNDL